MSGLFKSTHHCLYMAYLMEVLPVSVKNSTQVLLEAHMTPSKVWDRRLERSHRSGFEGMSPLDIRAQCALIRSSVEKQLNAHETAAIKTYYGHLLTKAEGIETVANYCLAQLSPPIPPFAALALAWGIWGTKQEKEGISLRRIAQHYGLSKSQAQRHQQHISQIGWDLLNRATENIAEALKKMEWVASIVVLNR